MIWAGSGCVNLLQMLIGMLSGGSIGGIEHGIEGVLVCRLEQSAKIAQPITNRMVF